LAPIVSVTSIADLMTILIQQAAPQNGWHRNWACFVEQESCLLGCHHHRAAWRDLGNPERAVKTVGMR